MPRNPDITGKKKERFPSELGPVSVMADGVEREPRDSKYWQHIDAHVPDDEVLRNGFIHWADVAELRLTVKDRYYPYITLVLAEEEFETDDDLDRSLNKKKHIYFVNREESGKPGWDNITDCFTAMRQKLLAYREKYQRSGHLHVEYDDSPG